MASPEAMNLEVISKAIDQHRARCPFPPGEIRMAPFEVSRLDWDHVRGVPIVGDPEMQTGRFKIVCTRDMEGDVNERVEAIAKAEENELAHVVD